MGQAVAPGFIGLQDDAKQSKFDSVRSKERITNSRTGVDKSIDRAITSSLEGQDNQKFAVQTLLITAPIGSPPNRVFEGFAGETRVVGVDAAIRTGVRDGRSYWQVNRPAEVAAFSGEPVGHAVFGDSLISLT